MTGPLRARSRRILVVDDDRDAVLLLCRMLERQGHVVRAAHAGPEAVTLAAQVRPELVLLDLGLPGMNGYEVASEIRALDPPFTGTLVAVTGYGREADRERTAAAGFQRHLLKPIDMEMLSHLLEELD